MLWAHRACKRGHCVGEYKRPLEALRQHNVSQLGHMVTFYITPRTALASPPFPSRPGTSIPTDHRLDSLEGLQMANNRRWTQEKRTEPSRRMSSSSNVLQ